MSKRAIVLVVFLTGCATAHLRSANLTNTAPLAVQVVNKTGELLSVSVVGGKDASLPPGSAIVAIQESRYEELVIIIAGKHSATTRKYCPPGYYGRFREAWIITPAELAYGAQAAGNCRMLRPIPTGWNTTQWPFPWDWRRQRVVGTRLLIQVGW